MRINWRKPVFFGLLWAKGSGIPAALEDARAVEWRSPEEIRQIQNQRLERLLLHAWRQTAYYREVLGESGVVTDGRVNLERFERIPFLTREILRKEGARLKAEVLPHGRKPYVNRTGGSTGVPVEFLQDSHYNEVNVADKLYHFGVLGKEPGELEFKIWGAERDLFLETGTWMARLQNFLYNRRIFTCAKLTETDIQRIIDRINRMRPKIIWSFLDGAYEISQYAIQNGIRLHSPAAVFVGATTLHPHLEESIERAFRCPAINYYGSREMGAVACQCGKKEGLHITSHSHRVEVVNIKGDPVLEEEGDIIVTSLANYAMPFIRYRIGDRGRMTARACSCGRGFPLLEAVTGRSLEAFTTAQGALVSPPVLVNMVAYTCPPKALRKYQLVQNDYDRVTVKMVLEDGASRQDMEPALAEVSKKIRDLMGEDCRVSFEFVKDIPPAISGKYHYTVSNVPVAQKAACGIDAAGQGGLARP